MTRLLSPPPRPVADPTPTDLPTEEVVSVPSFETIRVLTKDEAPKAKQEARRRFVGVLADARAQAEARRDHAAWVALDRMGEIDIAAKRVDRWYGSTS